MALLLPGQRACGHSRIPLWSVERLDAARHPRRTRHDARMSVWKYAAIFGVSLVAGAVNSIAGGGSLLSFPALVLLGVPPITANATNTVGLWPGSLAGVLGFRRDMAGTKRWLQVLIWPSLLGGTLGAVLLLHTPAHTFSVVAPFLVLA